MCVGGCSLLGGFGLGAEVGSGMRLQHGCVGCGVVLWGGHICLVSCAGTHAVRLVSPVKMFASVCFGDTGGLN